jgi:hypothetical protein
VGSAADARSSVLDPVALSFDVSPDRSSSSIARPARALTD